MLLLLKYWQPILAAVLTAALSYGAHSLDVYRIEDNQRAALEQKATDDKKQCDDDKRITKEASDGFQKRLTDLSGQLDALKRVQPSRCIAVSTPVTACGRNAEASTGKHAGANGITSDALYDFAGQAEKYRLQLIACQSFINETWAAKGQ